MKSSKLPPQEELEMAFRYEPKTGLLFWRDVNWSTPQNRSKLSDKLAGRKRSGDYVQVRYKGKNYAAHRIIWKMVTGDDPLYIDHIDAVKSNNKWSNLRNCTHSQNMAAIKRPDRELPRGVVRQKCGKLQAQLQVCGRKIYLGLFENVEDAGDAYAKAAKYHFGEFSR